MGEKIKDLHSIKIGSSEFMIELNEGYADEGRVIHIQNSHFRYLFKERDFLELAANILRAKSELDYIRDNGTNMRSSFVPEMNLVWDGSKGDVAREFSFVLETNDIDYRIIEINNRYVSVIINNRDYNKLSKVFRNKREIEKLEHPYGKLFAYTFLYQMRPFELIKYKDVYIELFFQLPCMSLTPKTWIPLEKRIQNRVWDECNESEYGKMLDEISFFIFRLCWSVFKDRYFTKSTSNLLMELAKKIDVHKLREYFREVFFSYTDVLMDCILRDDYEKIISTYFVYRDY